MYSFSFLGKDSFLDFGIIVEKRPIIPKPKRNIDYIEVPGRSGSLKIDHKTYGDIIVPIECWFKDNNVVGKADEVKAWLDSGEGRLILSNQTDKYYIAHVSEQFDITQELKLFGRFQVNFRCRPFKYLVNEDSIILTESGSISGLGTVASKPVITIYGSGAIDLTVNSTVIHLTNISEYVTIDSDLMDCYKETQLMNNNMLGEFPELEPGSNTISWTGSVTFLEVIPNWRWL